MLRKKVSAEHLDPTSTHKTITKTIERIQRKVISWQNEKEPKKQNPSCPAASSINFHTTNISQYGHHNEQTVVKQMHSYPKDTNNCVSKINIIESILSIIKFICFCFKKFSTK